MGSVQTQLQRNAGRLSRLSELAVMAVTQRRFLLPCLTYRFASGDLTKMAVMDLCVGSSRSQWICFAGDLLEDHNYRNLSLKFTVK